MRDNAIVITDAELKHMVRNAAKRRGITLTFKQEDNAIRHLCAAWDDLIASNIDRLSTSSVDDCTAEVGE